VTCIPPGQLLQPAVAQAGSGFDASAGAPQAVGILLEAAAVGPLHQASCDFWSQEARFDTMRRATAHFGDSVLTTIFGAAGMAQEATRDRAPLNTSTTHCARKAPVGVVPLR